VAIIQRPDLVEKIRALFGVTQGQVGGQLVDEIIPVVIVEDVSAPDQVSTQHPLRAIGGSNSAAGGATFLSKVGLQNPLGSGVDLFVESVLPIFTVGTNLTVRFAAALPASPNAGITHWADFRVDGVPAGVTFDENATVSFGTELIGLRTLTNVIAYVDLGVTLPPGQVLILQNQTANLPIDNCFWFWTERLRRV